MLSRKFWGLLVLAHAFASAAAWGDAFTAERWEVPGRVLGAYAAPAGDANWLAVISVSGIAPNERRFVTLGEVGGAPPQRVAVSASFAAVDFADLDPAPGPELVLLERRSIRIVSADGTERLEVPLSPTLPLPWRTRGLSRVGLVGDWDGLGRQEALVPDLDGLRVVPLVPAGEAHGLRGQVLHESFGIEGNALDLAHWSARLTWPTVALADDDGDGILELHAADRFRLATYPRSARGLAAKPNDLRYFPPFSVEEELRANTNFLRAESVDLDGDGLSDLIVHRTVGTLSGARAHAALHRNRGGGADPTEKPDAELELTGGFGFASAVDLDADGSLELVQISVEFGVVQMIRIMTRGRADVDLAVHEVQRDGDRLQLVESWTATISVPFDTEKGRVGTLLPITSGDWNGDGRLDMVHGDGGGLALRLGREGSGGAAFGDKIPVPEAPAEGGMVADLTGDGLDELVLWNPISPDGEVRILVNRGQLPGTRAGFKPRD